MDNIIYNDPAEAECKNVQSLLAKYSTMLELGLQPTAEAYIELAKFEAKCEIAGFNFFRHVLSKFSERDQLKITRDLCSKTNYPYFCKSFNRKMQKRKTFEKISTGIGLGSIALGSLIFLSRGQFESVQANFYMRAIFCIAGMGLLSSASVSYLTRNDENKEIIQKYTPILESLSDMLQRLYDLSAEQYLTLSDEELAKLAVFENEHGPIYEWFDNIERQDERATI